MGLNFIQHHSRYQARVFVFFLIIAACCLVTVYSSLVLKITTVYSHLFYIPVLLASIWWRRIGVPIVLFLSLLLLMSYRLVSVYSVTGADYLRVLVFLLVGLLIVVITDMNRSFSFEYLSRKLDMLRESLKSEKVRIAIMSFLLILSCMLTFFFHTVLKSGSVFTHFFYIPIIMAAMWWKTRGLWVSFFLSCVLLYGHLFMQDYSVSLNDYFRAGMFIVVPVIISMLGDRITNAEKQIEYLDFAVDLINSVTRLVIGEPDNRKLAEGFALALGRSYGCDAAVISLFGSVGLNREDVNVYAVSDAIIENRGGERPLHCHNGTIPADGVRIIHCNGCRSVNLCKKHDRISISNMIRYDETEYGLMTAVFHENIRYNSSLSVLLETVSDELAYALHNLETVIKKKKAEELLYYDELRAKTILELGGMTNAGYERIKLFALEEVIKITRSTAGYLAVVNPENKMLEISVYSKTPEVSKRYAVSGDSGIITSASLFSKVPDVTDGRGVLNEKEGIYCIEGFHINRHLSVPVVAGDDVVAEIGVANSDNCYKENDILNVTLLMQGLWTIIRQKKTEEELGRYRENLEEMINTRTNELEKTNKKLKDEIRERQLLYKDMERSVHELESFVNTVTHDLRSPLSVIGICAQIIERHYTAGFDEKGIKLLHQIGRNSLRMEELIRDLLALSRAGRENELKEYVDINMVIKDILERLHPLIKGKGIVLSVENTMPVISCIRSQIIQVFENLIANAVKYIGSPKEPVVEIGVIYDDVDYFTFYVKDNGIGIAEKHQQKIFQEFYRTHDTGEDGTGIGLAIVKKVIEKHGGTIRVESKPGAGSRFIFTLPARNYGQDC